MGAMARTAVALSCACVCALAALAEPYAPAPLADLLPDGVAYDPRVPTPEEVTGFALGDVVLPYELLVAYVRAVDEASDRVSTEIIGRTHLHRPILAVTVTSEANQARLDEIRAAQQSVLDGNAPRAADGPLVIEIVHGVHGAEPSGFDVAPLLLYHLAAAEGEAVDALRANAVVTLIVTLNPDGGARMAAWINAHRAAVPVSHPRHRERGPFFLWGRGNHYWFDLNRQWLPVTQPEAVAVVGWSQDWLPHVTADLHEMDEESSYFISPGPKEGLHPLLTGELFSLGRTLARGVMEAADAEGRLYVTEEYFDDYYLGYGSSYPGLMGAVSLLFEQSATRGRLYEGADGLQRYDEKIAEHFRSTMAMIETALRNRRELVDYQRRFFAAAHDAAAADAVKAYVFASPDPGRLQRFLDMLAAHRVEVRRLARDVESDGAVFRAGEAFVVPLDQPRYALVRALFEKRIPEHKTDFYDITGWTMPLAFGLECAELGGRRYGAGLLGEPADAAPAAPAPPESGYAYVLEWGSRYAPRTAYRLLDAGLRAKVLPAPTRVVATGGEVDVPRGAVMVPVADQTLEGGAIHELMRRAAAEDGVRVRAVVSGLTPEGPDLGGFGLTSLEAPRVLLVTGRGVSIEEAGEVWRLLDDEMGMPVVMIDQSELDPAVLYDFTHLVLVDGAYEALPSGFASAVDGWMRAGGVLTASRGGARWAMGAGLVSARAQPVGKESDAAADGAAGRRRTPYAERAKAEAADTVSGAVFAVDLDPTHPIAYGYETERSYVHRAGAEGFITDAESAVTVAWYPARALVSGYASEETQDRLAGRAAVVAERRGAGAAVLFADDPLFRGYWLASERMFLNALFFARSITPAPSSAFQ